ncbi:MAG: RNase adapter RapZ [Comamonas sp.]|nr:RNase adapter RapZ [Comamonas sp.]
MALELVLITGMSGSGKSVALHALEDAGYYCVDNLPPELLVSFAQLEHGQHANRVALAIDVRSATALPLVPQQLDQLRASGVKVQVLFLDARTETLVRRFSETRRRHPLSTEELRDGRQALVQSIQLERELLAELREQSLVIDTSNLRNADLLAYVKKLMAVPPGRLTLVFQSFAFKYGVPMDADYVFDVRMLPNPYYDPGLRPLTGLDEPVTGFLRRQPEVARMQADITLFLERWLPPLANNHRNYVTVAIGCTGGRHRSVYLVEQLAGHFASAWTTLKRHREQDGA